MASNGVTIEAKLDEKGVVSGAKKITTSLEEIKRADGSLNWSGVKEGEGAAKASGEGFTVLKGVFANLAAQGIMMATQALGDFASQIIETGSNFETSMSKVSALSGATGDELGALEEKARELGASTTFSASEAADALGYMALAGWGTSEMLEGVGSVLTLAQAGEMDLAAASDLVTDYLSAFNMQADEAARMVDVLAYAQANANTTTEGLGMAFKNCAANANAAGMDVETTSAAISMMANQGLKGSEAGTALNAVLRDMTARMEDGAIKIGEQSVAVMDAEGNYRDFADILADVESATDGMGDAEKAAALQSTFTADSIKGLNLMLNAGADELSGFREELYGAGVTTEKLGETMDAAGGDSAAFAEALERAGVPAETLDAALEKSNGTVDGLMDALAETGSADAFQQAMQDAGVSAESLQGYLEGTKGAAQETADVMTDNLGGDVAAMGSALEELQLKIYDHLEQPLRDAVQLITGTVIPGIEDFMAWLTTGTEEFDEFGNSVGETASPLEQVVGFLGGMAPVLAAVAGGLAAYEAYSIAVTAAEKVREGVTLAVNAAQALLNGTMELNPIMIIVTAIGALVAAFVYLWNNCEEFRAFFTSLWESVTAAMQPVADWFTGNVVGPVSEKMAELQAAFAEAWGAISAKLQEAWEVISPILEQGFAVMQGLFEAVLPVIEAYWGAVWDVMSTYLSSAWAVMSGIVEAVMGVIQGVIQTVTALISGDWQGVWDGISQIFQSILGGILNTAGNVFNGIRNTIGAVLNGIASVWSSIWGAVAGVASSIWGGIRSAISGIINGISSTISGVFNGVLSTVTGIWNGIKAAITGPIETARNIVKGAIDTISGIITGANLKLPEIKLPHFNIDGGELPWGIGGSGRPPSLSIDWYAKGGVFDSAQIIGIGEAGREAALPLNDSVYNEIARGISRQQDGGLGEVARLLASIDRRLAAIPAERVIACDGREVARLVDRSARWHTL